MKLGEAKVQAPSAGRSTCILIQLARIEYCLFGQSAQTARAVRRIYRRQFGNSQLEWTGLAI